MEAQVYCMLTKEPTSPIKLLENFIQGIGGVAVSVQTRQNRFGQMYQFDWATQDL